MKFRTGLVSMTLLMVFLCCGWTAPQACNPQPAPPDHTEAIAITTLAVIAVGTIIAVEIHHAHHTLKGCITSNGPDGMKLVNEGDQKTYLLQGVTPNLKPGDTFKVHGSRIKKKKGDTGDQTFVVEKVNKDYGPCTVAKATS